MPRRLPPRVYQRAAGQSRIWVSWQTNREPDLAAYRVYYRAGAAGPPWDDNTVAAVEGSPSPVQVSGTNVLLRGLALGTNYFVAVSAVNTTGNESPLSPAVSVTTAQAVPTAPTGVAARFGGDGTNFLMWALSEDDGYNDRDVVRYDIFLAVLPGGSYVKVGEMPAGIGLYSGTNPPVAATQYIGYAVSAVDSTGLSSSLALATRFMANGVDVDTDGDGIPDSWMIQYFGHPTGQASDQSLAQDDPDHDGLINLQEYLLGRSPVERDNVWFSMLGVSTNRTVELTAECVAGWTYLLQASTNLTTWTSIGITTANSNSVVFSDTNAAAFGSRYYRALGFSATNTTPHPADLNADFKITTSELAAYANAWKTASPWPVPPSPVPDSYLTNAQMIWKNGPFDNPYTYHCDPSLPPPDCWVPGP